MASKQEIFKVYKPKGLSMGQMINRFKDSHTEYRNSPITFAGRLDPLAEGLILLLNGFSDEEKKRVLKMSKEYEFEFVFGFETDTYDILGIVTDTKVSNSNLSQTDISSAVNRLKETKVQEYPPFSSKTVNGKALHSWAREGALSKIEIPKRNIEVFDLKILKIEKISSKYFLKMIEESISLVEGDFRQIEILSHWRSVLDKIKEELVFVKMKSFVSSGTYIRGLVNSLGKDLKCGAVVYSIKRTKIGDMEVDS